MKLEMYEQRHWQYAIADDTLCAMCKDGFLFMFDAKDVEHLLGKYPKAPSDHHSGDGYFFNETLDREIGNIEDGRFICNPQFVYQNFKEVLV